MTERNILTDPTLATCCSVIPTKYRKVCHCWKHRSKMFPSIDISMEPLWKCLQKQKTGLGQSDAHCCRSQSHMWNVDEKHLCRQWSHILQPFIGHFIIFRQPFDASAGWGSYGKAQPLRIQGAFGCWMYWLPHRKCSANDGRCMFNDGLDALTSGYDRNLPAL